MKVCLEQIYIHISEEGKQYYEHSTYNILSVSLPRRLCICEEGQLSGGDPGSG